MKELKEYSIYRPPGTTGKKPRSLSQRIEDFWKYVRKLPNGCWEWTAGTLKSGGYGQFNINGEIWRTHVLSWILKNGPVPDKMEVCHECDNPLCVNPEHLFLGTHNDNMQDMITKGRARHPCGEDANFTVPDDQVMKARRLFAAGGIKKSELARMFKISRSHMGNIINGSYRKYLPLDGQPPKK